MDFSSRGVDSKGKEEPSSSCEDTNVEPRRSPGVLPKPRSNFASLYQEKEERNKFMFSTLKQKFKPTSQLEETVRLSLQNDLRLTAKTEDPKLVSENKSLGNEKTSFTTSAITCHEKKHPYSYPAGFGSNMEIVCWREEQQGESVVMQQNTDMSFYKDCTRVTNILCKSCNDVKYANPALNPSSPHNHTSKSSKRCSYLTQSCGIESTVGDHGQTLTPVSATERSSKLQLVFVLEERRVPPLTFTTEGGTKQSAASTNDGSSKVPASAKEKYLAIPSYPKTRRSPTAVCPIEVSITKEQTVSPVATITEGAAMSHLASSEGGAAKAAAASDMPQSLSDHRMGTHNKGIGVIHQTDPVSLQMYTISSKMQQQSKLPCQWETCAESADSAIALFHHIMKTHLQKSSDNTTAVTQFTCQWRGCTSDSKKEPKRVFRNHRRLISHVEKHCQEIERPEKQQTDGPRGWFAQLLRRFKTVGKK